eukprot:TRINITY_DN17850_c0_g1_i1.p2 TRINITY_DN17850_c0_g1~~TRINITY_DN17850_c0_g1_i1.p2  ORF type:complete len:151 (-),score=1.09 TRINITY_DN17850_c0_g1_i1:112-564(-)
MKKIKKRSAQKPYHRKAGTRTSQRLKPSVRRFKLFDIPKGKLVDVTLQSGESVQFFDPTCRLSWLKYDPNDDRPFLKGNYAHACLVCGAVAYSVYKKFSSMDSPFRMEWRCPKCGMVITEIDQKQFDNLVPSHILHLYVLVLQVKMQMLC